MSKKPDHGETSNELAVPTASSQGVSHSLRKDASDSTVGTVGQERPKAHAGSEAERTRVPQTGNKAGSRKTVLAGSAGGSGNSPPVALEIIGLDLASGPDRTVCMIVGPRGTIKSEKPIALVLLHMMDGRLYPIPKLQEIAGFATPDITRTMLHNMQHRLRDIGIVLHFWGDLVRIAPEA